MKILKTITFCVALFVLSLHVAAQESSLVANRPKLTKPKLFKELPDRISVNFNQFDDVFNYEKGKTVLLKLSPELVITGDLVSRAEDVAAGVKTIVIRATNRPGATLSLSRFVNANNTISYRGMLMSFRHEDAYEVVAENGAYFLIKKEANILYEE